MRERRRTLSNRSRLSLEQLETRALLTVAAFEINLYTDLGGAPGQLITDDSVHLGDTFFVEITAQDVREGDVPFDLRGLHGISVDIAWDPDVLISRNDPFIPGNVLSDKLPAFQHGVLDNAAGTIDDLSGSAGLSEILVGGDGPERYALLRFEAIADSSSPLVVRIGKSAIAFYPPMRTTRWDFEFEPQTINVLPAEPLSDLQPQIFDADRPTDPSNPPEVEITQDLNQLIQTATAPLPVAVGTVVDTVDVPTHLCPVISTPVPVPPAATPAAVSPAIAESGSPADERLSAAPLAAPLAATTDDVSSSDSAAVLLPALDSRSFDAAASAVSLKSLAEDAEQKASDANDAAAVDVVLTTTSTQELLAGTKQVYVDSALIQALAFALATAKDRASLESENASR